MEVVLALLPGMPPRALMLDAHPKMSPIQITETNNLGTINVKLSTQYTHVVSPDGSEAALRSDEVSQEAWQFAKRFDVFKPGFEPTFDYLEKMGDVEFLAVRVFQLMRQVRELQERARKQGDELLQMPRQLERRGFVRQEREET